MFVFVLPKLDICFYEMLVYINPDHCVFVFAKFSYLGRLKRTNYVLKYFPHHPNTWFFLFFLSHFQTGFDLVGCSNVWLYVSKLCMALRFKAMYGSTFQSYVWLYVSKLCLALRFKTMSCSRFQSYVWLTFQSYVWPST